MWFVVKVCALSLTFPYAKSLYYCIFTIPWTHSKNGVSACICVWGVSSERQYIPLSRRALNLMTSEQIALSSRDLIFKHEL